MWSVERGNISCPIINTGPATRLHGSGGFQCEFIEIHLAIVPRNHTLPHQTPEVAISRDIIETVIVDTDVCHVGCHLLNRVPSTDLKELLIAGSIKLKDSGAELKPLCPLGPAACRVSASDGKNGCPFLGGPCVFYR